MSSMMILTKNKKFRIKNKKFFASFFVFLKHLYIFAIEVVKLLIRIV